MEPVSNGLEHRDALLWRAPSPRCRWPELSPKGFGLEDQSLLERQGRGDCWSSETQEQSQEMGS